LQLDLKRIQENQLPGIALILLVLRDLAEGRIALGYGTNRGMGSIEVAKIIIQACNLDDVLKELESKELPNGNLNELSSSVLISELNISISQYLQSYIPELAALDTITQKYILWGEGVKTSSPPGWGKLAKSRIGSIYVPITGLTANKRVYLTAVEYLKADEEYGNVSVVEERLIGLEVK
jgi:CRISPR-associated protein (TIGR03984 family)